MISVMIFFLLYQVKDIIPRQAYDIEIVTRKKDTYYLLPKGKPTAVTVEGPTYLRIYTRIPWAPDAGKSQIYKLVLTKNELEEQILTFESEKSAVTKDQAGRPLSKWRSFYIEVPEGTNKYVLQHWSSPRDTILFKIAYESPKTWQDIAANEYNSIIEVVEEEKIIKYYELTKDQPVRLKLSGPENLKITVRLNYDDKVFGEQQFNIIVDDNGKIDKNTLKCYKSDIITYYNRKDIVPSNAKNIYLKLSSGQHSISLSLEGSTASSAALRLMIEK